MKNYTIKRYNKEDYKLWNNFVSHAKNATFLFYRDFMDYHSDRFEDYSLIILDGEKWVAILPANVVNNDVHSHQGLTYGGLIYDDTIKLATIISVFKTVLEFLNQSKIEKLFIKPIPTIYHQKPAEELQYALFLTEAKLTNRESLSVIDLKAGFKIAKGKKEGIDKGKKNNLTIREVVDFKPFWNEVLTPNLIKKHDCKPIHSLEEITKLNGFFLDKIRQFNVYKNDEMIAGTTIFESQNVAHTQYISANEKGIANGGLDFLFSELILNVFGHKKYFDFGSSNGNFDNKLNTKLSFWKERFGASTIVQDFYEVQTVNFNKIIID